MATGNAVHTTPDEWQQRAGGADCASRPGIPSALLGDSKMGERIRAHDWSTTPLGPIEAWPVALHTAAGIVLCARVAMAIGWGPELTLLYNDAWTALIGDRHPGALGQPAQFAFSGNWETVGPLLAGVMSGRGETEKHDHRLMANRRGGDVEEAWFDCSFSPIVCADGTIGGVFCVAAETTGHVHAEQALRQNEERLHLASSTARVGTYTRDLQTGEDDWSPGFLALFGLGPGDSLPLVDGIPAAVHPVDRERVVAETIGRRQVPAEPDFGCEHRIILPGGEVRWVLVRGRVDADEQGQPVKVIGMAMDITGRVQAEEALRETERQYSELVQYAPAAIYEIDFRRNEFVSVNDAMCRMTGYSRKELLAKDPFDLLDAEGRALFQRRIQQWIGGVRPDRNVEFRVKTKDGRTMDAVLDVTFTVDGEGRPRGATVVAHDVTERRRRERRISRYNGVLRGINRIFEQVIRCETEKALGETCLDVALEVTGSQGGFVGEVGEDGYLHDIAVSNMGWDQCRVVDQSGHRRPPGDFVLHGLYGRVIDDGKGFFANDPSSHPDSIGVPPGHLSLTSFLGVPLVHEDETFGMLAVANRGGGYSAEQQEDLEALAPAVVEALFRRRAEAELRSERQLLRTIYNTIPVMLSIYDPHLEEIVLNKHVERVAGWTPEDTAQTNIMDLTYPDPAYRQEIAEYMQSLAPGFREIRMATKDGRTVETSWANVQLPDGRQVGIGLDISAQVRTEKALRESEQELTAELETAQRLHQLSTQLIQADDVQALYEQILDTAVEVVHADLGSLQAYFPDRGAGGELLLLGYRGFDRRAAEFWERVTLASPSVCGEALRTGQRVVVPDVQACDFLAGTDDLEIHLQNGIRAVQATPLLSRSGTLLGMISTHWRQTHELTPSDLRALDVLARQAADLIDRTRAEQALRQSRERLRAALNASGGAIYDHHVPLDESTYHDERWAEMLGYRRDELPPYEHFLDWLFEQVHPEDLGQLQRAYDDFVEGRTSGYHVEVRLRHKQGHWVWVEGYSNAVERGEAGRVRRIVGVMSDIAERKRAEEALHQYAERLRVLRQVDEAILAARSAQEVAQAVVEGVPRLLPCLRASVLMRDQETGEMLMLAVYHRGESKLGAGQRGILGPAESGVLERLARGETYVVDDLQASSFSAPAVIQLKAEGVRAQIFEPIQIGGQLAALLAVSMDVPGPVPADQQDVLHDLALQLAVGLEQARLYEEVQRYAGELEQLVQQRTAALEASEVRFRTIFEEAAIGIALVDTEGVLMATNPALRRMLGYDERELAGARVFDLLSVEGHCDELPEELLSGQRGEYTLEQEYVRKDGEIGQANVTLSLLHRDADQAPLVLVLAEDITERVQARMALIRAEKLAILGRMTTSLAHEINNPIQSVVGCLSLAMEVLADGEDATRFMEAALEESERAARIVHRLRDLTRSEEVLRAPASVGEMVDKALVLTHNQAQNQQVALIWEGEDGLPEVPVVRDRIQQVFLNLVLNAIDAMPEGGKLRVRAVCTENPPGVSVSFTDTGVGMQPEQVERIFEGFHSTKEMGLGLGLHVSHNIIREHGGQIDVESEPGHGTTFTVWLPLS